MKNKRGDLELKYIILLILGVIVLVSLIIMFRTYLLEFVNQISTILKNMGQIEPPIGKIG